MAIQVPAYASASTYRSESAGRGLLPGFTRDAVKDISPMDIPFWTKCKTAASAPSLNQLEMVDAQTAITAIGANIAISEEPATRASALAPTVVENFIIKKEFVFAISEEMEKMAKEGGYAGGITSWVLRDIQRKTKQMFKQIEFDIFSKTAGAADGLDGTTAACLKGYFTLVTTNANYDVDSTGTKAAFEPTAITDVGEANVKGMLKLQFDSGCGSQLTCYAPTSLAANWSNTFQGRPGIQVQVKQSEALNMMLEHYVSFAGVDMEIVPSRTIANTCCAVVDHDQFTKRMFLPFEVRRDTDNRRAKSGYGQVSFTVLPGVEAASGGWYTSSILTTSAA